MAPSSFTHLSTAASKASIFLTSTDPMPITFAPLRAVAILFAIFSVFSTFLPIMHALAPRWTRARTWALQIEPPPPVQKTTLFSRHWGLDREDEPGGRSYRTKNAIFPHVRKVLGSRDGHGRSVRGVRNERVEGVSKYVGRYGCTNSNFISPNAANR
jgi:hypothetical protein